MTIRPATSADFPELLAIQIASIKSLSRTYQPDEISGWIDYIQAEGADRYARHKSAVAEDDSGQIQAFVSWSIEETVGKVDCLFTLPAQQSQGIGKHLLQHAEHELNTQKVRIRTTLGARKFYERHGYSFVEFTTARAGFAIAVVEKSR
jgi:predicted N-acetyltransferase YhbS